MSTPLFRKLLSITALVVSVFLFTACPDKKNNGGVQNVPPVNTCVGAGCVQGTNVIAQALGKVYSGNIEVMNLGLIFSKTQASGANVGEQYYYGQAIAVGTLTVRTNVQRQFCPIQPGVYQVVTVTPANWQAQSFSELRLEATGAQGRLQIRLPNNFISPRSPPVVGADGVSYPYALQNMMIVEAVNGVSCSYSGLFTLE